MSKIFIHGKKIAKNVIGFRIITMGAGKGGQEWALAPVLEFKNYYCLKVKYELLMEVKNIIH